MLRFPPRTRRWSRRLSTLSIGLGLLIASASPALAQSDDARWGIGASFTPKWKANTDIQNLLLVEGDPPVEGTEFTIGLVRGSTRGGDWGISYVRKPVTEGLTVTEVEESSDPGFGYRASFAQTFRGVYYQGVEIHKFWPFGTIAGRVQIGLNMAGGVASIKGEIDETIDTVMQITWPDGTVMTDAQRDSVTGPVTDYVYKLQPLAKLELQGAVIVAPALKIKVSAGVNAPSTFSFRVGAVVLIGG